MKDVEGLIANLSREAAPQRRAARPGFLFASWLSGACLYAGLLLIFACHPRPDLAEKMTQPLFAAEIGALLMLTAASSLSATLLAFPDLGQKRSAIFMPVAAFVVFAAIVGAEWVTAPDMPPPAHHAECLISILFMALPPAAWIFARTRQLAPVRPMSAGAAALLAAFSIGALVLRLSEPTDSINHLIGWHYLPMIGITLIGLAIGKKFFRW